MLNFGYEEVRTGSTVLFPVDDAYKAYKTGSRPHPFHMAILNSVTCVKTVDKKFTLLPNVVLDKGVQPTVEQVTTNSVRAYLRFEFKSPDGLYTHNEDYWDISPDFNDAGANADKIKTANDRFRMLKEKVANMYENLTDMPNSAKIGLSPENAAAALGRSFRSGNYNESFCDYLEATAILFNAEGIFADAAGVKKQYIIKLIRQGAGKSPNNLQIPISGGVQVFVQGAKLRLQVKPSDKFLTIEDTAPRVGVGTSPAGYNPAATFAAPTAAPVNQWPDDI